MKITISFKNTPQEIELYAWILEHSNYSGFVKDILRKEKNILEKQQKSLTK